MSNAYQTAQHEETAHSTRQTDGQAHGMVVAKKDRVVAKHEQQVATPHNEVEFHERHDRDVARHGAENHLRFVATEEMFLNPDEKIAARSDAKHIDEHKHSPKPKTSGHDEVFGTRQHQLFELSFAQIVHQFSVDVHHRSGCAVKISGCGAHHTVCQFGVSAKSLRIIKE